MRWPFDIQAARYPRDRITVPGWAPPALKKSLSALDAKLAATALRVEQNKLYNVPGAVKGEVLYTPSTTTRLISATARKDILVSGQTYGITIPYNSPGVFVARTMTVYMANRVNASSDSAGILWKPLRLGQAGTAGSPDFVTVVSGYAAANSAPFTYMWNLEDPRSGKRFADDFMSCVALLPGIAIDSTSAQLQYVPGGRLVFDTPWLFERDSQLQFMLRPLQDLVQADTAGLDVSVLVRVELHGTRFFTEQDALRQGARIP